MTNQREFFIELLWLCQCSYLHCSVVKTLAKIHVVELDNKALQTIMSYQDFKYWFCLPQLYRKNSNHQDWRTNCFKTVQVVRLLKKHNVTELKTFYEEVLSKVWFFNCLKQI